MEGWGILPDSVEQPEIAQNTKILEPFDQFQESDKRDICCFQFMFLIYSH